MGVPLEFNRIRYQITDPFLFFLHSVSLTEELTDQDIINYF